MNATAVGEGRPLVAASGKPAIDTRIAESLTIEIGGKRTEVRMPAGHGEHAHAHAEQMRVSKFAHADNDGDADGERVTVTRRVAKETDTQD